MFRLDQGLTTQQYFWLKDVTNCSFFVVVFKCPGGQYLVEFQLTVSGLSKGLLYETL